MAGKDDLKLLASHVYSLLKPHGVDEDEAEAVAAVTMNKAIGTGSLIEAIQADATPDLMEVMQNGVKEKDQRKFNRVVQKASIMLRGIYDITKGATEYYPKKMKVGKSSGLSKTHSTKNYSFYRPGSPKGRVPKVSKVTV